MSGCCAAGDCGAGEGLKPCVETNTLDDGRAAEVVSSRSGGET